LIEAKMTCIRNMNKKRHSTGRFCCLSTINNCNSVSRTLCGSLFFLLYWVVCNFVLFCRCLLEKSYVFPPTIPGIIPRLNYACSFFRHNQAEIYIIEITVSIYFHFNVILKWRSCHKPVVELFIVHENFLVH